MDHLASRHGSLDRIEEADEFLMPVAGRAAPDQGASRMFRAANSVVVPWRL